MTDLHLSIGFHQPHRLFTTHRLFDGNNPTLLRAFDTVEPPEQHHTKAIAFVDAGLVKARPDMLDMIQQAFAHHADLPDLVACESITGGEVCKNDLSIFEHIAQRIAQAKIDRHSYVLAVGGGAVLDVVGFAAAVVHRGVRLVRVPTTTMAQADSGIGVKNGVNLNGIKNLLGSFAIPHAVVNDHDLLTTLSQRDWRAGFSEAVKVALLKDHAYFLQIESDAHAIAQRDHAVADPIIHRSAELHMRHIATGGDPFEQGSARPLDLGHWSAHRLETLTDFQLRHGEAVAIGLAIDAVYAGLCSLMPLDDVRRVITTLQQLGFTLSHPMLNDPAPLLQGLNEFREHLGGPLTLILPAGLGSTVTVNHIDRPRMTQAITRVSRLTQNVTF